MEACSSSASAGSNGDRLSKADHAPATFTILNFPWTTSTAPWMA